MVRATTKNQQEIHPHFHAVSTGKVNFAVGFGQLVYQTLSPAHGNHHMVIILLIPKIGGMDFIFLKLT